MEKCGIVMSFFTTLGLYYGMSIDYHDMWLLSILFQMMNCLDGISRGTIPAL